MTTPTFPPGSGRTPGAEVTISEDLVRGLIADQHPDLADLPLSPAAEGWDNQVWRLGPDLAVRLPRRAQAAPLVVAEQRWLPLLAPRLPVPVPAPVRVGLPGRGFPWPWSVVPWLVGRRASQDPDPTGRPLLPGLVELVVALHQPAGPDAPVNPFRGGPLATRDEVVRRRLEELDAAYPGGVDPLLAVWEDALAAEAWAGGPRWLHGDLHPGNLLVTPAGVLAGVLDFGDLTAGDPATDLAVAWMVFDVDTRAEFAARLRAAGHLDDATWRRARGWALAFGLLLAGLGDDAEYAAVGHRTLAGVRR